MPQNPHVPILQNIEIVIGIMSAVIIAIGGFAGYIFRRHLQQEVNSRDIETIQEHLRSIEKKVDAEILASQKEHRRIYDMVTDTREQLAHIRGLLEK